MSKRTGTIHAVCMSPDHGYPTYPQDTIDVGLLGIPGDAHSGPLRESFRHPGVMKPNDRPICIVSWEAMQAASKELGIPIPVGSLNEQLVVEGLGDLGWVPIGSVISFPESPVTLEIVDYAYPCVKLATYHKDNRIMASLLDTSVTNMHGKPYSKRGILAKVLTTGILKPGMSVTITQP